MILNSKTMFKISLFGWELVLLRFPKVTDTQKEQGIQPSGVYIKREGNFLMACDENGYFLRPQVSLTVNDGVDKPSTITVEYFFAGIYEEPKEISIKGMKIINDKSLEPNEMVIKYPSDPMPPTQPRI